MFKQVRPRPTAGAPGRGRMRIVVVRQVAGQDAAPRPGHAGQWPATDLEAGVQRLRDLGALWWWRHLAPGQANGSGDVQDLRAVGFKCRFCRVKRLELCPCKRCRRPPRAIPNRAHPKVRPLFSAFRGVEAWHPPAAAMVARRGATAASPPHFDPRNSHVPIDSQTELIKLSGQIDPGAALDTQRRLAYPRPN